MDKNNHEYFMKIALKEANKALKKEEVPVGCVIVYNGKVVAKAYNQRETKKSSIAHAEMIAIEKACKKQGDWRLEQCDLYVTLEPCMMCSGAISLSRIRHIFFGAYQNRSNDYFNKNYLNFYPTITGGLLEEECSRLLKKFFKERRKESENNESI